jgi:hypothetical protein
VTDSRPHDLRADHLQDPLGIDADVRSGRQKTLRMNSTAPVAGGNEPLIPAEK